MSQLGIGASSFGDELLAKLKQSDSGVKPSIGINQQDKASGSGQSFLDHLKDSIKETNGMQKSADKLAVDVATGKSANLHETMLAVTQAELTFNLMVQVRNRALEAYQEVMRMPV